MNTFKCNNSDHQPNTPLAAKPKFVSKLRIAVVCSSNQNRSMEAHNLLKKRGYNVESYGTGSCVKLPGPTIDKPNVYDFNVTYDDQRQDLKRKDAAFYTQNGLLNMLDRNRRIKAHPEKFQECKEEFDIVVTCQERVFDQVIELDIEESPLPDARQPAGGLGKGQASGGQKPRSCTPSSGRGNLEVTHYRLSAGENTGSRKRRSIQQQQQQHKTIIAVWRRHTPFDSALTVAAKPKFVSKLRIAVVCSSNQNRSMEAHNLLKKRGYNVESYGTGSCVKLPGPTIDKPNVYDFSVTYDDQRQDLKRKDAAFYTQNGLLNMLDRNRRIKAHPEKFQECKEEFDIVVTCQERVFDQVIEHFTNNGNMTGNMAHVINVEIKDNHEDATLGAFVIHDLIREICGASDHEAELEDIIEKMEAKKNQNNANILLVTRKSLIELQTYTEHDPAIRIMNHCMNYHIRLAVKSPTFWHIYERARVVFGHNSAISWQICFILGSLERGH
eukprot:sb/3464096/